jgi:hypothetical protein
MTGHRIRKFDSEEEVHERLVRFMKREHPGVLFRTDFAAGILLPPWLAARQKRVQSCRGFPDIFVYEPSKAGGYFSDFEFNGLALELKAKHVKLKLNDGRWASDHIKEQFNVLSRLHNKGYACSFARGYDEACAVINWYLKGSEDIEFSDFIPKLTLGEVTDIEEAF